MLQFPPTLSDYSGLEYQPLIDALQGSKLQRWADALAEQLAENLSIARYGDLPRWLEALQGLPELDVEAVDLAGAVVRVQNAGVTPPELETQLRKFHPWRKGPFNIANVHIDTEWRSDLKWQRLLPAIEALDGRTVLDVGCGSGYHCWRMAGEGAALTIGIEPTPLFVMQFWALQRYIQNPAVWVVPQRIEQVPATLRAFDTVFSMGILYHRRSPFEHLQSLRDALRPGGQLVLETLVIDDKHGDCLVPVGRYAKMGNVWFIPSCASLTSWLSKMKFKNIELVDVSATTEHEQRSTDWMTFESLKNFLDPDDPARTIEGYPAPRRAIVTAIAP